MGVDRAGRRRRHRRAEALLRLGGHLVGAGEYVSATVSTLYTAAIALIIGTVVGLGAALLASR